MYEYRINKSEYDDIHPEETLADGLSGYSSVEVPVSQGVFGVVYLLLGIMFAAIIFQAIALHSFHSFGVLSRSYFRAMLRSGITAVWR